MRQQILLDNQVVENRLLREKNEILEELLESYRDIVRTIKSAVEGVDVEA